MLDGYLCPDTFYTVNSVISGKKDMKKDEFIRLLYTYPLLEKQYNIDGSEKNIHELFDEMLFDLKKIVQKNALKDENEKSKKEYYDCEMFYYELILLQIEKSGEDDYNKLLSKYGAIFIQNVFADMEKYFNSQNQKYCQKNKLSEDAKDEIERELEKKINSIVRFRNGAVFNPISEMLLREGGFVRGTREKLSKETLKRREMFARSLVGVYDAVESEDEYSFRAENEKTDIDEVINALYYNRFEGFLKNVEIDEQSELSLGKAEVVRTAQILKIALIISSTLNKNFFIEFLKIPDVNRFMTIFEKDENGYLRECIEKSRVRIKKVVYPATEAENGKFSEYILGNDNSEGGIDIENKIKMLKAEMK